jgi:purine-binding chemotaxis protein CheW
MSIEKNDLQIAVFSISNQNFGIDIVSISEIIRLEKITPIPQAPAYVKGVINIREQVVPAINLHVLFNIPAGEMNDSNRVIVVETGQNKFGLIVDAVSEVRKITPDIIKPAPPEISIDQHYLKGIILDGENLIILMDVNKLLPEREMQILKEMEQPA